MKTWMSMTAAAAAVFCTCGALSLNAQAKTSKPKLQGWQNENGKRYYYLDDGSKAVGTLEIDGIPYVFAPNGAQQLGWQTADGKRYYYDADGEAVFGWFSWRGETYYVSRTEGKLTGSAVTDEKEPYLFDEYGVREIWQQTADGDWFCPDYSGEIMLDDVPYLLDKDGSLLTGWQTASDGVTRFYDAESHEPYVGWVTDDAGNIRRSAGMDGMLTGLQQIEGATYLFDEDGVMQTGLCEYLGTTRYFNENGIMQTGWVDSEDGRRCFDSKGIMIIGLHEIDADTYYFDNDGLMLSGLLMFEDGSRFFGEDGAMQDGWQTFEEGTRYFSDGLMVTGTQEIEGTTYYFDTEGLRLTGWQTVDEKEVYLLEDGTRAAGLTVIEGKTYLFDENGEPLEGWFTAADGARYYAGEKGAALTGWQEINEKGCFFSETGVLAVNTVIDGYTIDGDGAARCQLAVTVDNLLTSTDQTPMGIYSYCVSHYWYAHIEATRTVTQLLNAGWTNLITYTLNNHRGVCYYLAATLDYYLQRAGYTTRLVHATHSTGNHYWVQVLVDGNWQNYDPTYTNRGNLSWDYQIALGDYYILGYLEIDYDPRGTYVGYTYTNA